MTIGGRSASRSTTPTPSAACLPACNDPSHWQRPGFDTQLAGMQQFLARNGWDARTGPMIESSSELGFAILVVGRRRAAPPVPPRRRSGRPPDESPRPPARRRRVLDLGPLRCRCPPPARRHRSTPAGDTTGLDGRSTVAVEGGPPLPRPPRPAPPASSSTSTSRRSIVSTSAPASSTGSPTRAREELSRTRPRRTCRAAS